MKKTMTVLLGSALMVAVHLAVADTIIRTDNSDGTTTFDHGSGAEEHVQREVADDAERVYAEKGHDVERGREADRDADMLGKE